MIPSSTIIRAAALGAATGIRSMTPLAVTAWAATSHRISTDGTVFSPLADRRVAAALGAAAAGEIVADKLPFVPARINMGPWAGRVVFGTVSGAAVGADDGTSIVGAVAGGLCALAATPAAYQARKGLTRMGLAGPLAGSIGDLLCMCTSLMAVSVMQRRSVIARLRSGLPWI